MLALSRVKAALGRPRPQAISSRSLCPPPKARPTPLKLKIPSRAPTATLWRRYCTATEEGAEEEDLTFQGWQKQLGELGSDYAIGDVPADDEQVEDPLLGNIHRHIPADHFNWGVIKDHVFGDFGKRAPPNPIRRLSFVPEPTPDEAINTKIPIPEPMAGFSEYEPLSSGWHIPLVPKPRPITRDGNSVTGLGRRKRAVANVTMTPGSGKIMINGRHWMYYFKDAPIRNNILEPLTLTEYLNKWDIDAHIQGGGFRGQAGAMRLAISRALLRWDPELQPPLKRAGYLTRDKREVERKKPGKLKARRSFQWVKR